MKLDRTTLALFDLAVILVTTQCYAFRPVPPQTVVSPPPSQTALATTQNPIACQIDPTQAPALVDRQLGFIELDVLQHWSPPMFPNITGPTLDDYKTWLSKVAAAISADQSPNQSASVNDGFITLSRSAFAELLAIGAAAPDSCVPNLNGCKDLNHVAAFPLTLYNEGLA